MEFTCNPEFDGLLTYKSATITTHRKKRRSIFIQSVSQNMVGYTKVELDRAKLVQEFVQQQAYMSITNLKSIIKNGIWSNLPFTLKDVENSVKIYGASIPALKGKTKKRAQEIIPLEEIPRAPGSIIDVDMLIDFMFINSVPFLIGLGVPVNFAFVYYASS
eukprot:gene55312-75805_t